jgi:23S rRNA (uridine2552-2'-O)-methyltransferase
MLIRKLSTWINRHINDPYVKQSVKDDLRSRSAYKILEIQDAHKIIKPNDFVIDLGAAPGG